MIQHDRDRLVISVGVAVLLHAVLFGILAIVGFDFTPYPETSAVYVTLPEYDPPPEPEPEDLAVEERAEEPPVAPTEPEQTTRPDAQPAAPSEQAPADRESSPRSEPAPAAPETSRQGSDAPPGSFSNDDLPWLNDDTSDRERSRTPSDDLFGIDEPDDVNQDVPSWVTEGSFSRQPESTLDEAARESLDEKRETLPGFSERLSELMDALETPPQASPGTEGDSPSGSRPDATGPGSATTALPGGSSIEWVGSGSRRPVGDLTLPELTASDFDGQVPARASFLIVFEVNADGLVVPGSLILRQSSGYTVVDQKIRRAVSSWRFDRAPGSPPVTAITTLHITRDQIR
ncbi:MAG: hypothetical protein ACOC2Y_04545 [Spirochaetota bacterium]